MTVSLHDHTVREVTISAVNRIVRLVTTYPDKAGRQGAGVLFEGVQAYAFSGDALGTILFDIEPVDPLALYGEWAEQMRGAYSKTGGHAPWVVSDADAAAFLAANQIMGYRISSSIGFEGAVWATSLTVTPLGPMSGPAASMKNIQVIDGADNCVYDIFAASEDVFNLVFAPGTDVAFVEVLENRPDAEVVFKTLETIWPNRVAKSQVHGIQGTLFYGLIGKRKYYPARRDEEAMNPDGSPLRAGGLTTLSSRLPPRA